MSLGFQLYRTGFYRIEVVVVARKESQPAVQAASCAGCELCGREPALPAFSTGAHPLNAPVLSRVFIKGVEGEKRKRKMKMSYRKYRHANTTYYGTQNNRSCLTSEAVRRRAWK